MPVIARSDAFASAVVLGWLGVVAALCLPAPAHATTVLVAVLIATVAHAAWALGSAAPSLRASRVLVATALCAHAVAVGHGALFSDDVARYAVDAASSHAGLNPLAYPPGSAKMAGIADGLRPAVNHPELRSIYPPLAQAWFAVVQAPSPATTAGLRVGAMLAVFAAAWLLRRTPPGREAERRRPPAWLVLLLHPLPLVCGSLDAHVDVLGLPLGVAICAALASGRRPRAGLWVGVAVGVKLVPAVLLPALLRGPRGARAAALALLVVGAVYLPWIAMGPKVLGSLGTYVAHWEFNSGAAAVVSHGVGRVIGAVAESPSTRLVWAEPIGVMLGRTVVYDGTPTTAIWVTPDQLAQAITRALSLAVLGVVSLRALRRGVDPIRSVSSLFMAVFLTSAVVHPWYLLWLLPPALWSGRPSALVWCSTVMLAFAGPALAADTGVWTDPAWIRVVEYVPVFAILLWRDREGSPHL